MCMVQRARTDCWIGRPSVASKAPPTSQAAKSFIRLAFSVFKLHLLPALTLTRMTMFILILRMPIWKRQTLYKYCFCTIFRFRGIGWPHVASGASYIAYGTYHHKFCFYGHINSEYATIFQTEYRGWGLAGDFRQSSCRHQSRKITNHYVTVATYMPKKPIKS